MKVGEFSATLLGPRNNQMQTASQRNAATREEPVPTAPQPDRARQVPKWGATGPAPAGTLHRPHTINEETNPKRRLPDLDDDYIPRRGAQRFSLRALGRTRAGRITMSLGILALLAGLTVAGLAARHALVSDRRFLIATSADIDVTGNHHLTRAEVLRLFSADVQHNIFRVPLAARRASLEQLPWVEHATITRLLPNRLRIDLHERTPIAFVRQGTQIGLVDTTGVLLDMPALDAGDPHYSFPVLTGLTPPALPADAPLSTRAARLQIYTDFLHQLDSTGHHLSTTISEVDVTDPEDLKAIVSSNAAADQPGSDILVHFGDQDFLHRYEQFQQHLPTWRQQYPRLASADMRYDAQVVLEMQPGTTVPTMPVDADPALTAATTPPPPPTPKPATGVNVPPRPVIISHNATSPAPAIADVLQKPGAPSSPTVSSSVRVGSQSQNSGAPSVVPDKRSLLGGVASVPLHGTGGTATKPASPTLVAASPRPSVGSTIEGAGLVAQGFNPGSPRHQAIATTGASAPEGTSKPLANPAPKPTLVRTSTPKPTHSSSANEKLFAQLAADHKAAMALAAKSKPRQPGGPSVPLHGTGASVPTKPHPGAQ